MGSCKKLYVFLGKSLVIKLNIMPYNKKRKSYKKGRGRYYRRSSSLENMLKILIPIVFLVNVGMFVAVNLESLPFTINKNQLNEEIEKETNTKTEEMTTIESDEKIYQSVDEKPAFPGCEDIEHEDKKWHCSVNKARSFIYDNLEYPAAYIGKGGGMVHVRFVVDKDGNVVNPEIYKDPNGLGDIVLKTFPMMPHWIPGKRAGVAVNTEMFLTIDVDERQYIVSDKYEPLKSGDGNLITPKEMAYFVACEGMTNGEKEMCNKRHIVKRRSIFANDHVSLSRNYYMSADYNTLTFVVTKEGKITNIEAGCFKEDYNIFLENRLKNMQWIPARYKGEPVNVELFFPCGSSAGY